jgi:hypothetical protein
VWCQLWLAKESARKENHHSLLQTLGPFYHQRPPNSRMPCSSLEPQQHNDSYFWWQNVEQFHDANKHIN